MTRRSRVMSLWNYFDLPSHELWYFISQKPLFQKFHFKNNSIWWTMQQILRNDFEKWYIMALVPWYIISQNHFSKFGCLCFVYIHLQWWAGPYNLDQPTQPQCWVLLSQPAPIHREYEKNISRKLIYILLILKCSFLYTLVSMSDYENKTGIVCQTKDI